MLLKDVSSFEVYTFKTPDGYDDDSYTAGVVKVLENLDELPAIDAVPVVRCKNCMFWKPTGSEMGDSLEDMEPIGGCRYVKFARKASDFCSFGEPRGERKE